MTTLILLSKNFFYFVLCIALSLFPSSAQYLAHKNSVSGSYQLYCYLEMTVSGIYFLKLFPALWFQQFTSSRGKGNSKRKGKTFPHVLSLCRWWYNMQFSQKDPQTETQHRPQQVGPSASSALTARMGYKRAQPSSPAGATNPVLGGSTFTHLYPAHYPALDHPSLLSYVTSSIKLLSPWAYVMTKFCSHYTSCFSLFGNALPLQVPF